MNKCIHHSNRNLSNNKISFFQFKVTESGKSCRYNQRNKEDSGPPTFHTEKFSLLARFKFVISNIERIIPRNCGVKSVISRRENFPLKGRIRFENLHWSNEDSPASGWVQKASRKDITNSLMQRTLLSWTGLLLFGFWLI